MFIRKVRKKKLKKTQKFYKWVVNNISCSNEILLKQQKLIMYNLRK